MSDCFSGEKRSEVMRAVGQRDTDIELILRRRLWHGGHRYRVQQRVGRARPDICFGRQRLAVYVDGCFWHGCPRHYTAPKSNAAFWKEKLKKNQDRDRQLARELERKGWTVLRFWECDVRSHLEQVVSRIEAQLNPG